MASNLVANHLLVNVDGLWQKGVKLERVEADAIEGGVAVDRVHNVQPRLEMKKATRKIRRIIHHKEDNIGDGIGV